jgi:hypothetical protein
MVACSRARAAIRSAPWRWHPAEGFAGSIRPRVPGRVDRAVNPRELPAYPAHRGLHRVRDPGQRPSFHLPRLTDSALAVRKRVDKAIEAPEVYRAVSP